MCAERTTGLMKSRRLHVLGCLVLAVVCTALPQSANRNDAVVLTLLSSTAQPYQEAVQGFRDLLHRRDVPLLEYTHVVSRDPASTIRAVVAEKQPDLILALGARATGFAAEYLNSVPVVYGVVFADEDEGAHATGVTLNIPAYVRLEGAKQILPDASRVGFITSKGYEDERKEVSQACARLGLELIARQVDSQKDFADALSEISTRIDMFIMTADPALYIPQSVTFLLRKGLEEGFPVIGLSSSYTKAGALLSFDCDYRDLGRQAAEIALLIVKGVKPSDVPAQAPERVNMSLNLSVADRLGIRIPNDIVAQAAQVFGR
ncbi:MAG: hypothetical protein GF331_23060 [Chitinivibrionales bacterium]|nr:hypothetical protein [Chitinivibrionales bacterium]